MNIIRATTALDLNLNMNKLWLDFQRLISMQSTFLVLDILEEILTGFSIFMVFSFLKALSMEELVR